MRLVAMAESNFEAIPEFTSISQKPGTTWESCWITGLFDQTTAPRSL